MKNMRKLIPAIAMLMIAVTLLSTGSYAWFSLSESVTVSSMNVKAVTHGGIYQSAPSADGKNWKADPIEEEITATVSPTVLGTTFNGDSTVFYGNYSDSASNAVDGTGENGRTNTQLTTAYAVNTTGGTGYTGTFNVSTAPAGNETLAGQYPAGRPLAAAMHFFLAIEGEQNASKTLKCSVKQTNSGASDDAVIRQAVAVQIFTKSGDTWTNNKMMLSEIQTSDTEFNLTDAVVKSMEGKGTEVWILMYLEGNNASCTTTAASLYEIIDTLEFTFTADGADNTDPQPEPSA